LIEHSYKADSDLSPAGWEYADRLKEFVLHRHRKNSENRGDRRLVVRFPPKTRLRSQASPIFIQIWTSTRRRAHHTAWPFLSASQQRIARPLDPADTSAPPAVTISDVLSDTPSNASTPAANDITPSEPHGSSYFGGYNVKVVEKQQMSEINPGIWDGLSPDQAQKYYPQDWARFVKDPYSFRAPRAESYHDLSVRLEPILIELEREKEDLLIIGHASVIRCMLAYLIGLPASEIPAIEIARGDLLEVTPASYGVHSTCHHFWDGPGRSLQDGDQQNPDAPAEAKQENNFYENYAEDTKGKKVIPDVGDDAAAKEQEELYPSGPKPT
jgi:6-phosphofructo-2-kinase / fructose-2,6-biphosphatase 4